MKELTPLLEKLAEKLGTTSEMLWKSLLKQAPITATVDVIIMVCTIIGLIVSARGLIKNGKQWHGEDEIGKVISLTLGVGFLSLVMLLELCGLSSTIAGFFNPEYWALNKVLSLIK